MTDISFENHGSIVLVRGLTDEGQDWLDEHIDEDAPRWSGGIAVEPRFVSALVDGILESGLEIT
jgi:hypothetical protein